MRIFAVVSYNGANYQGWAKQPDAPSIQETIENVLSQIFNRPINIYGAGRTDAGVHALGQTFHFDVDVDEVDLDRLLYSLNAMLPQDIKIEDIDEVEPDFHARFSAKEKVYGYTFVRDCKVPLFYQIMYPCPYNLDMELFKETLTHFIGEHNFKNFTSKPRDKDNFVRQIFDINVTDNDDGVNIVLRGTGFMRYMIRYIVGAAIEVARGKMTIQEIDELLDENSKRNIVSCKAPACGLILLSVVY